MVSGERQGNTKRPFLRAFRISFALLLRLLAAAKQGEDGAEDDRGDRADEGEGDGAVERAQDEGEDAADHVQPGVGLNGMAGQDAVLHEGAESRAQRGETERALADQFGDRTEPAILEEHILEERSEDDDADESADGPDEALHDGPERERGEPGPDRGRTGDADASADEVAAESDEEADASGDERRENEVDSQEVLECCSDAGLLR